MSRHMHENFAVRNGISQLYRCENPGLDEQNRQAMEAAVDEVEANADKDWITKAKQIVIQCAEELNEWTTDDAWSLLSISGLETHDPRALGAVLLWARRKGIAKPTGEYRKSVRRECHCRPIPIYRGRQ